MKKDLGLKSSIKLKTKGLLDFLQEDEKLKKDKEKRMSFLSIAQIYLEDFNNNIEKTSIEMDTKVPLGVDVWKEFLSYPVVYKYIQSFKDEKISNIADKGLMEGDKNAVGIKKVIQDKGPTINNSNIILIRLPEKRDIE